MGGQTAYRTPGGSSPCEGETGVLILKVEELKNEIEECLGENYNAQWFDSASFNDIESIAMLLGDNGECSLENVAFIESVIEVLIDDINFEIEALFTIYTDMDKQCQALILFRSIFKIDSDFTNMIKDNYFSTDTNDIILNDINSGEGNPPMQSQSGAATDPNPNTTAETSSNVINIQFNNLHLDTATDLGFVQTFYHELLHAHIYHLYHNNSLLSEYPEYTGLKTALDNSFADGTNVELQEIAQQELHNIYVDFIDEIAESLVEYCNINNISNVDIDYAKKLVWGGLNGYDVFEDNLTEIQKFEAQTLLGYENSNTTQAKGSKTCD